MPVIPRSPGVQARPTTETGMRAPSIAQSQIIPRAIQGLGQDISKVGDDWQRHKQRQQEEYDASQALDLKNKIKDFENEKRIELAKAPADQNTINNFKQKALEERQEFIDSVSVNFEGNRRLQKIAKQQSENALVNFEFGLDKELLQKQRKFQEDTYINNITSIKKRYETAVDIQDFVEIERDLEEEMQTALKLGTIDFRDIDRQQEGFRNLRKQRQDQIALDESVRQVLSKELIVDPKNKKIVGKLDEVYNNAIASGKVQDPIAFGEEFATSTGIIPKQFKSFLEGQVMGGNPQQRVEASLSVVDMLESDKNSLLQGQIPNNVQSLAYEIYKRNDAGLSPSDSVKFATEELEKNKSQERQLRSSFFDNELKTFTGKKNMDSAFQEIIDDLEDETGGFFTKEANVPVKMAGQLQSLAKDLYLTQGMSFEGAMKQAKDKIKSEWHVTEVGEKRYQRFAPEKFYPDMTSKEIRSQAIQQIRKNTIEELPNIKDDINLTIIPDSIATSPSYFVGRKQENGSITPVFDNRNQPMIFTPDITKTERYKEQMKAREPLTKQEAIKKMGKKRERAKSKSQFLGLISPI